MNSKNSEGCVPTFEFILLDIPVALHPWKSQSLMQYIGLNLCFIFHKLNTMKPTVSVCAVLKVPTPDLQLKDRC